MHGIPIFYRTFLTETLTDAVVNGRFVNKVPADIQIYTYFTTGLDPKRLKDVILDAPVNVPGKLLVDGENERIGYRTR
jgi:hypothetical protein